jgi:hypothetical protein
VNGWTTATLCLPEAKVKVYTPSSKRTTQNSTQNQLKAWRRQTRRLFSVIDPDVFFTLTLAPDRNGAATLRLAKRWLVEECKLDLALCLLDTHKSGKLHVHGVARVGDKLERMQSGDLQWRYGFSSVDRLVKGKWQRRVANVKAVKGAGKLAETAPLNYLGRVAKRNYTEPRRTYKDRRVMLTLVEQLRQQQWPMSFATDAARKAAREVAVKVTLRNVEQSGSVFEQCDNLVTHVLVNEVGTERTRLWVSSSWRSFWFGNRREPTKFNGWFGLRRWYVNPVTGEKFESWRSRSERVNLVKCWCKKLGLSGTTHKARLRAVLAWKNADVVKRRRK